MSYNYRGYNRRRRQRRMRAGRIFALVLLVGLATVAGLYASGRLSLEGLPLRPSSLVAGVTSRFGGPEATATSGPAVATATTTTATTQATDVPSPTASRGVPTAAATTRAEATGTPVPAPTAAGTTVPEATATSKPTSIVAERPQPTRVPLRKAGPARRLHTVARGETLYGLSLSTGVPFATLARVNGLTTESEVYVGQVLLVPTRTAPIGIKLPGVRRQLQRPKQRPLAQYSPDLVSYLRSRSGTSSAAVYFPDSDTLYTHNPNTRYLTASTVKVPIMITQLSREYARSRDAESSDVHGLLAQMIAVGDNDVASELFRQVGGKRAIEAELRARGIARTDIAGNAWGLSETTAPDMALLMRSLYYGERLNPALRQTAVGLLGSVVESQRWGVPEGLGASGYVAFKGGWLQREGGWLVHQVGMAEVYGQNVIFAFYNANQPSEVYGRETLEDAGRILAQQIGTR